MPTVQPSLIVGEAIGYVAPIGSKHYQFIEAQASPDNSEEIKMIATKLALNEMKLNKWNEPNLIGGYGSTSSKEVAQWTEIYEIVWLEKLLFVETVYNVRQILELSTQIRAGQDKMITALGVIVNNQGAILNNQEVIITNQGVIIDVTGQILENTEEIIVTTNQILGVVEDIQVSVNDMQTNGVKVKQNNYSGGGGSKMLWYVAGGIIAVIILIKVLKRKKQ